MLLDPPSQDQRTQTASSSAARSLGSASSGGNNGGGGGEEGAQVYCICREVDDGVRPMISCGRCDEWFHLQCIGVSNEQAEMMYSYVCPNCTKAQKEGRPIQPQKLLQQQPLEDASFLGRLPDDVSLHVLSFLGPRSLCRLLVCSRACLRRSDGPLVWESLLLALYRTPRAVTSAAAAVAGLADLDWNNTDMKALYKLLWPETNGRRIVREEEVQQLARDNAHIRQRIEQEARLKQQISARAAANAAAAAAAAAGPR
jgi:hypothetical protein